ncbi:MAG: DUF3662 domain-containing protein [Thermoleophilia bacterium]|nr:DUF3662 domain-containing protein [Thermoleophilia bacterium]
MSVLKKLEEKIQGLFEGGFSRAFKSPVQPVELARKLVKEMEDHKVISVSRVYAPNEYTLFLAPEDAEQFEAYEEQLKSDLADYLIEHARKEGYDLLSRPIVIFETDADLEVGEFGIATRMVSAAADSPPRQAAPPEPAAGLSQEMSQTVVYRPPRPGGTMAVTADEARELELARECVALVEGNRVFEVNKRVVQIGRSRQSDVVINDPNVSRHHAELRQRGTEYMIVDLESTNGIEVNGRRVVNQPLNHGDIITMGTTKVRFERKPC